MVALFWKGGEMGYGDPHSSLKQKLLFVTLTTYYVIIRMDK